MSDMLTFEVAPGRVKEVMRYLKAESSPRFLRLEDLTAIDESGRRDRTGRGVPEVREAGFDEVYHRRGNSYPDFTLVYHLLSMIRQAVCA